MMTAEQLIETANRAWQAGEIDLWKSAMWLLRTLHPRHPQSVFGDELRALIEAQKDHQEYVEEMSIGGRVYRP